MHGCDKTLFSRKKIPIIFFTPESSKKDLTLVKRVLPEVPTKNNNNNAEQPLSPPPTYEESEAGNSNSNQNNNIRKTANPLPAPRNSLLEEAKVDKETSKKKKNHSNKHKNNKDTVRKNS